MRIKSPSNNRSLKKIKGLRGSSFHKQNLQKYKKGLVNKYKSRKLKKRFFRSFWINTINNYLTNINLKYSLFIFSLKKNRINLNRKTLFSILIYDKIIF